MNTNIKLNLSIGSEGLTVRICIQNGTIVVFGSYTVPNPSPALHDFQTTLNATDFSNCFALPATASQTSQGCNQHTSNGRKRRQTGEEMGTLYLTIEGASEIESQFSFNSSYGVAFECATDFSCGRNGLLHRGSQGCFCGCLSGYRRSGEECLNINECAVTPGLCGENGVCTDTDGNYTCGCQEGYERDEQLCININECAVTPGLCGENGVCADTIGNYTCGCQEGYEMEDHCININECAVTPGLCGENGVCTDTIGNYTCECQEGYEMDGQLCININECAVTPGLCGENGVCTDTIGNYTCGCREGYEMEDQLCTKRVHEGSGSVATTYAVAVGVSCVLVVVLVLILAAAIAVGYRFRPRWHKGDEKADEKEYKSKQTISDNPLYIPNASNRHNALYVPPE